MRAARRERRRYYFSVYERSVRCSHIEFVIQRRRITTIKHTGSYYAGGFLVVRSAYLQYGDKAEGLLEVVSRVMGK
jgi:hypothetical protein